MISRAKDQMQSPEDFSKTAHASGDYRLEIATAYGTYQKRLKANHAVDFDDIIYLTVEILENFPEAREYYQKKFRYVSLTSTRIPIICNTVWRSCWQADGKMSA